MSPLSRRVPAGCGRDSYTTGVTSSTMMTPLLPPSFTVLVPKPKRWSVEDNNPIEERGWTYQERWLLQRVLHYGFRGLSYFCKLAQVSDRCRYDYYLLGCMRGGLIDSMEWCEGYLYSHYLPPNLPPCGVASTQCCSIFQHYQSLRSGLEDKKHDLLGLQSMRWHECIEEYSQRQMFDPDSKKFNAISAVAQKHGRPQHYAAGLWRDRLASDLAWCVVPNRRNEPLHPRSQTYRAPSWSWAWASVDNAVSFWPYDVHPKFSRRELESVRITAIPLSARLPFGPIQQGAEMDVRGDVASVTWMVDGRSLRSDIVTRSGVHFKAFPDTAGQAQILSRNLATEEDGSLRVLVLIRSAKFGLCGLILQCLTTASKFRRVGFCSCCDRHQLWRRIN